LPKSLKPLRRRGYAPRRRDKLAGLLVAPLRKYLLSRAVIGLPILPVAYKTRRGLKVAEGLIPRNCGIKLAVSGPPMVNI